MYVGILLCIFACSKNEIDPSDSNEMYKVDTEVISGTSGDIIFKRKLYR